jgi:hypothetical protein
VKLPKGSKQLGYFILAKLLNGVANNGTHVCLGINQAADQYLPFNTQCGGSGPWKQVTLFAIGGLG